MLVVHDVLACLVVGRPVVVPLRLAYAISVRPDFVVRLAWRCPAHR
jgi:hypothetical protein